MRILEKRKTYTSTSVKRRYNEKTYSVVRASIKKELVAKWEEAIKKDNISKAEFIRQAINQYLENKKK